MHAPYNFLFYSLIFEMIVILVQSILRLKPVVKGQHDFKQNKLI